MPAKKPQQKSVLSQLQSVGEGAIEKITHNPAARTALQSAMNLKDRGNQFVTGLLDIEKRLLAVEKRLAALERSAVSGARTAATRARTTASTARTTATKASTTAAKTTRTTARKKP